MGVTELAHQKRKERIDEDDAEPLHSLSRSINAMTENSMYCNVPARLSRRMGLEAGTEVVVDVYRDRAVIRLPDKEEENGKAD